MIFSQFFNLQKSCRVRKLEIFPLAQIQIPNKNSEFMIIQMDSQLQCIFNPQLNPMLSNMILWNMPLYWPQVPPSSAFQPFSPMPSTLEKKEKINVDLTIQELMEAGYDGYKRIWTEEEDKILMKCAKRRDMNWKEIADKIPGRTSKMCYSRFRRIQNRSREKWTTKEDRKICQWVQRYGYDWQKMSDLSTKRTPKQIEDHYMNYLRPEISKEPWCLEEDLMLIQLLAEYGKDWKELEKKMQGRTQGQIKNRYFGRLKRLEDKKKYQLSGQSEQNYVQK